MKCEKCGDKGFTEQEHGQVMVLCDCEKGAALRAEITGEIPDDSDSGTGQPDSNTGSGNTSKPQRTVKSKAKKKAGARTG